MNERAYIQGEGGDNWHIFFSLFHQTVLMHANEVCTFVSVYCTYCLRCCCCPSSSIHFLSCERSAARRRHRRQCLPIHPSIHPSQPPPFFFPVCVVVVVMVVVVHSSHQRVIPKAGAHYSHSPAHKGSSKHLLQLESGLHSDMRAEEEEEEGRQKAGMSPCLTAHILLTKRRSPITPRLISSLWSAEWGEPIGVYTHVHQRETGRRRRGIITHETSSAPPDAMRTAAAHLMVVVVVGMSLHILGGGNTNYYRGTHIAGIARSNIDSAGGRCGFLLSQASLKGGRN